ncbi:MAG: alpha/beta hydrolase [Pseudomonadota bacterium]
MNDVLHPDMQALLAAREGLPDPQSIADERANWTTYSSRLNRAAPSDMQIDDIGIDTPDRVVPVRRYRPAATPNPAPAIVYLHGGGFMKGDLDSSDAIAWGYAALANAYVFSVDYRLTPEYPYPAAFNDTYGVAECLSKNPHEFGIDPAKIALAGDSAGGNLAAATCIAARDRGGPSIRAQVLVYPGTGLDQTQGSYIEHANAFGLTTAGTIRYRDLYLPDNPHTDDPYARPVIATDHANLPPAWVHSAEIDPIRDDGRAYASKLALAGNEVHYREAKKMIHGFMRARFVGAGASQEFDAICGFLRAMLHDN